MKKINKKGFTLIELLVVIAIIGLLATLSVIALNNARAKSRDAKRVADVRQIQTALELYFNDNLGYPGSLVAGSSIGSGTTTYMQIVPAPPTPPVFSAGQQQYTYTSSDSNTYTLQYCLEGNVGSISSGCHTATNA